MMNIVQCSLIVLIVLPMLSYTFPIDDYPLGQIPRYSDIVMGDNVQDGFDPVKRGRMGWRACNTFFKWRCGRPRVPNKKSTIA